MWTEVFFIDGWRVQWRGPYFEVVWAKKVNHSQPVINSIGSALYMPGLASQFSPLKTRPANFLFADIPAVALCVAHSTYWMQCKPKDTSKGVSCGRYNAFVVSRQKKAAQNMGQAHSSLNRSQPIIRKSKLAMLHYLQSFTVQRKAGENKLISSNIFSVPKHRTAIFL